MSGALSNEYWATLIRRIKLGKCTPFLGAGACQGTLELGTEVAGRWADKNKYPLADRENLPQVAQFLAVQAKDGMYPKELIAEELRSKRPPDFNEPDEPHAMLAELQLPVYITTNYDNFMVEALRRKHRDPKRDFARWNDSEVLVDEPSVFDGPDPYRPSPANPLVFHLHGVLDVPESMVLTEDDYVDFLVAVSKDTEGRVVPSQVRKAISDSLVMFMGYSLNDWDFRVIYRWLSREVPPSRKKYDMTVQFRDDSAAAAEDGEDAVRSYLETYFGWTNLEVFWGSARQFAATLRERWEESNGTS